ncbi:MULTISPECIES: hypothetical protein [unclassified Streptomyces]|uniref:hypothetical protein n=1 Tax=unclassified Streptomyces TaxID=2593676 RepID=UPI0033BF4AA7
MPPYDRIRALPRRHDASFQGDAPADNDRAAAEERFGRLGGVCAALDCVHVPVEPLQEEYDGVVDLYGDRAWAAFVETLGEDSPFFAPSEEDEDEEAVPLRWMDRYFDCV